MLACFEPLSVSTRGLPVAGPNRSTTRTHLRQQLDANLGRQRKKFRLEFRCELDYPHR